MTGYIYIAIQLTEKAMKPTMSMALNKEHLAVLELEYYRARSEILDKIILAVPKIEPFRSSGFLNKDYDMARISFDLPIVSAKLLMNKLK